jgi:predicted SAM-dependent methyltransferase
MPFERDSAGVLVMGDPPFDRDHDAAPTPERPRLRQAVARDPAARRRLSARAGRAFSRAAAGAGSRLAALRAGWWRMRARGKLARAPRPLRLCLGSGSAPLPGWVNVDFERGADVRLDLRFPLPLPDRCAEYVYSEHMVEHLDLDAGLSLFRECRRVLADDGVFRAATPDLAALVRSYETDWRAQDWVNWPGHEWIDSAARMLNVSFHSWGHRHLYDEAELTLRLRQAGFAHTRRCSLSESSVPALAGLETREDSLLVVEAWGRAAERTKA